MRSARRARLQQPRARFMRNRQKYALICRASSYTDLSKINAMLLMTFSKDIGKKGWRE
jgi:hypothetical protein